MANDWDVNTGTIRRTGSRQNIATIGGCNSQTPTTYPPPYLSPMGTRYHHHGCTVPTAGGSCQCRAGLVSPSSPGAVVLVAGGDHRQAARFPTFWEPLGSGVLVNIDYTCPVGSEWERWRMLSTASYVWHYITLWKFRRIVFFYCKFD
jgi:hypothetical protein